MPQAALTELARSNGKYALVASLWASSDSSWLDGTGCNKCNLDEATYKVNVKSPGTVDESVRPPVRDQSGRSPVTPARGEPVEQRREVQKPLLDYSFLAKLQASVKEGATRRAA